MLNAYIFIYFFLYSEMLNAYIGMCSIVTDHPYGTLILGLTKQNREFYKTHILSL